MTDQERISDMLPLRPNWFHILVSLAGAPRHGYGVMQDVFERTGGGVRLWPATLYGSIKQLCEQGLIREVEDAPGQDDDPRRRYYAATDLGRRVLAAEGRRLRALADMASLGSAEEGNEP